MNVITSAGLCTRPGTSLELAKRGCVFLLHCVLQTSSLSLQNFLQEIPKGFNFILTAAFFCYFSSSAVNGFCFQCFCSVGGDCGWLQL